MISYKKKTCIIWAPQGGSIHELTNVIFHFHEFTNEKKRFHEFANIYFDFHEPRQNSLKIYMRSYLRKNFNSRALKLTRMMKGIFAYSTSPWLNKIFKLRALIPICTGGGDVT